MYKMFVVTYSVKVTRNERLTKAISDKLSEHHTWWHYIAPTWLVVSDKNADEIARPLLDRVREAKGRLLVMEVRPKEHQGLLPKEAWKWINEWATWLENQKS